MIRLPPAARALIAFPNRSWGSRPRLYAAVRSADCDSSTTLVPLRALAHGSVDFGESRSGDRECLNRGLGLLPVRCRPFGARWSWVGPYPGLGKPRPGLNSARCSAAVWRFTSDLE